MILFSLPIYEPIAKSLGLPCGRFEANRFPNGELHIAIGDRPAGEDCVVLGSVAPPDDQMLTTLLLCHTLRKEGASRVTATLPYLGYSRHDKIEPGQSLGAAWIGEMLNACGVDECVTIDVHSREDQSLFPIPLRSISPAQIFGREITARSLTDATIVAPDEGAVERCDAVRMAAGIERPAARFRKVRTAGGVKHFALEGEVSRRAIVFDDILDTGGTLVSCCELLRRAGVQEIAVMVTHGQFTGSHWEKLWSLGVTNIFCSDSIPLPGRLVCERIVPLSVAGLLRDYLCAAPDERSG